MYWYTDILIAVLVQYTESVCQYTEQKVNQPTDPTKVFGDLPRSSLLLGFGSKHWTYKFQVSWHTDSFIAWQINQFTSSFWQAHFRWCSLIVWRTASAIFVGRIGQVFAGGVIGRVIYMRYPIIGTVKLSRYINEN